MDYLHLITSFLGTITVAAGSGVAISWGLFRFFGEKWISAKFDREKAALQAQRDANLRHVQSFIDQQMHRAKKLYDREFDVVSEAWTRLCKNFDNCVATGKYCPTYDFDDMADDGQLELLMAESTLTPLQKADVARADDPDLAASAYRLYSDISRGDIYMDERRDFHNFVRDNGMYMPPGLQEKFMALEPMFGRAILEFQAGIHTQQQSYASLLVLERDGRPLQQELAKLIQARLWSASSQAA